MESGAEVGEEWLIVSPAARREAILGLLRSAQRTIILSMFRCDDFTIVDELAAAVKRGVNVRILITRRARGWKNKLIDITALLKSLGAEVMPYESSAMKYHAKYIVADDGPALVTTLNFTRKCLETTCDFLVFTEDQDVVAGLKILFDHDCRSVSSAVNITDRLIVGPDQARRRLNELFGSARETIAIMDHRVTDPQMLMLLTDKQNKGVSVRIIGEPRTDGLVAHGRMAIIDRKTAIVGSIHLSSVSLDSRREVALRIVDTTIVTELYDYFENLAGSRANIMNLLAAEPIAAGDDEDDEEDE